MRLKIKYKIFKGKVIVGYLVQREGFNKSQIISRENILKFSDYFEGVSFTRDGLIRKAGYPIDKCSFDQVNELLAKTEVSIDLNKYKNNKLYDGNTRKFGVTINGQDFIVKFSKTPLDTSVFSEYVASNFICNLGFKAHITKLVKYNGETAVLIKDFTTAIAKLRSFKDTSQSSEDTNLADKAYSYEDVLYLIEKHKKMNNISKQEAIQYFWQMYVLDAILANRDRHHGNWGYLTTQNGYEFAPIYDNGSSLFPEISKKIQEYSKDRFTFLQERSERFPASLLMQYSESERRYKRTNYNAVINSNQYSDLTKQVNLFRSFGVNKVYAAIRKSAANSLISVIYQQFYVDIVCMRYLHIIQGCTMTESFEILTKLARGEKV